MEIPIVLNSDAHNPLWLDTAYGETEELLKKIGYKTQRALYDGIWQDVPIG
jgi:histidinol-phosphatase (PHP family)